MKQKLILILFYITNTVLAGGIAYLCVEIAHKYTDTGYLAHSFSETAGKEIKNTEPKSVPKKTQYDTIIKRNLFKVEVEETKLKSPKEGIEASPVDKLKATTLKLVLWGTVTGVSNAYAVIEDKKVRQQSLYEIGDTVQGAKIKQILRHKVILNYKGTDQVLEIEIGNKNIRASKKVSKNKPGDILLGKSMIDESFNDLGLMKQIKMRPHFTEGEPDGLMVFGIKPDSVFRQIGLRNGDIVKEINGTPIVSVKDTFNFYSEIKEAPNAKVTLLRRGQVKELIYQVENGVYTSTPFPDDESKGDK